MRTQELTTNKLNPLPMGKASVLEVYFTAVNEEASIVGGEPGALDQTIRLHCEYPLDRGKVLKIESLIGLAHRLGYRAVLGEIDNRDLALLHLFGTLRLFDETRSRGHASLARRAARFWGRLRRRRRQPSDLATF